MIKSQKLNKQNLVVNNQKEYIELYFYIWLLCSSYPI